MTRTPPGFSIRSSHRCRAVEPVPTLTCRREIERALGQADVLRLGDDEVDVVLETPLLRNPLRGGYLPGGDVDPYNATPARSKLQGDRSWPGGQVRRSSLSNWEDSLDPLIERSGKSRTIFGIITTMSTEIDFTHFGLVYIWWC